MQMDFNPEKRYIDIWLAGDEEKPNVKDLKLIFPDYQICVFHSGTGDLAALTAELLRINAARMADDEESDQSLDGFNMGTMSM